MNWIDAHCHLADPKFEHQIELVVQRSKEANVNQWLQGGTYPDDWERQKALRGQFGEGVLLAFGLHPWWVARYSELEIAKHLAQLENEMNGAIAVGEIGLDFLPKFEGSQSKQCAAFEAQLLLGKRAQKPMLLHVVQAHEEALAILEKHTPFPRGGLIHAFSGSIELAHRYLSLGFMVSVGAAALRGETGRTMIACLPSEALLVETDAPDQLPAFLNLPRGTLNEPAFLVKIAEAVGALRGEPVEKVLAASSRNLRAMLGTLAMNVSP